MLNKIIGKIFGVDLSRFEGATKVHDVEARFRDPDRRTIAKVDQNIWNNGLGGFQIRIRRWPGPETELPIMMSVEGRDVIEVAMTGATLDYRVGEPYPNMVPKIAIGDRIQLRRGDTAIETTAKED